MIFYSLQQLQQLIRTKQASIVELCQAYLAQIEMVNPALNALHQVDEARILQVAHNYQKEIMQGNYRGLLHGIPITIKDNLLTQDIITTGGSFAFREHRPEKHATVVQRLCDQGAIILGKSNLPDFALAWETESSAFGRTNNPYNLMHTPGGSSGGEAAALAAGASALGIGTDSGGSIRLPSHYCGIAGLRPSRGIIPSSGHMPPQDGCPILGVFASFTTIGPMARYVNDLRITLPIMAGPDHIDPYAEQTLKTSEKPYKLNGLRVAFYTTANNRACDKDIEDALRKSALFLAEQGAQIVEIEPPNLAEARKLYVAIVGADGGEGLTQLMTELGYDHMPEFLQKSVRLMPKEPTLRAFLDACIQCDFWRMQMNQFMLEYDIILCPVAAFTALPHGQSLTDPDYFEREHYLLPYNLMGWPALSVRVGTSRKALPIGAQIVAKHREDYLALYVAEQLESAFGGWQEPNYKELNYG